MKTSKRSLSTRSSALLLVIAGLLCATASFAKSFSAGDHLVCDHDEGEVLELLGHSLAKVHFTAWLNGTELRAQDQTGVLSTAHCQRQLGPQATVTSKRIGVSDVVLCNQWNGQVLALYQGGLAKVRYFASYAKGFERKVDGSNLHTLEQCDKRLDSGSGRTRRPEVSVGQWIGCEGGADGRIEGEVLEVYTGNRAKVRVGNEVMAIEVSRCETGLPVPSSTSAPVAPTAGKP